MYPTNLPISAANFDHQYGALETPNVPVRLTQTVSDPESDLQQRYPQSARLTFTKRCAALMSALTQKQASDVSDVSRTTAAISWAWTQQLVLVLDLVVNLDRMGGIVYRTHRAIWLTYGRH